MGLTAAGITPTLRITANDADITQKILANFSTLQITDESGESSDMLEIVLADTDRNNPVRLPPKGAVLEVWLGYDANTTRMGVYVADETSLGGWPGRLTIRARSAIYANTPKGALDFQTQKTRTWKAGTKLGDMVAIMAKEHGMTAAITASMAAIQLPHLNQDSESDINLLLRLAKRYDATTKPMGGKLIFAKRGDAKTLLGAQLPTLTVLPEDVARWDMTTNSRGTAGTVAAYYHSNIRGRRHEVKVGDGEPVQRIRYWFKNHAEALAAAQAQMRRRQRAATRMEFSCEGHPEFMAEGPVVLQGWHPDVPLNWIATRVQHNLTKGGGYTCDVSLELPNDPADTQFDVDSDGFNG